jgi:two-component sensor histidine kinase
MEMHHEIKNAAEHLVETERRRVEAVVETLATLRSGGDSLAELAHDARNMVTALGLYCDLLEEPGVLATEYAHYGNELRLVAAASRRLVEKLVGLDVRGNAMRGNAVQGNAAQGSIARGNAVHGVAARRAAARAAQTAGPAATFKAARPQFPLIQEPRVLHSLLPAGPETVAAQGTVASGLSAQFAQSSPGAGRDPGEGLGAGGGTELGAGSAMGFGQGPAMSGTQSGYWDLMPPELISNLEHELIASRNLLSALAGPSIVLTVDAEGCALPVRLNAEDLTRVLVNLVKNAAEAMPAGGSIHIGLRKRESSDQEAAAGAAVAIQELSLLIEDTGPGIPRKVLERVFEAGFTTRVAENAAGRGWPSAHRGLGLSITRSIVEAASGRIYATNREGPGTPGRGARFEIVLPVRSR